MEMKRLAVSLAALMAAANFAHAADLPVVKAPAAAEKPNCFASFQDWFYASPKDCPLSYGPFTLFGVLDMGAGWNEAGTQFGGRYDKGVYYGIKSQARGARWSLFENALSSSGIGIKFKQSIAEGWDIIGQADTGWNPYSGMFMNGPKSLTDMNRTKAINTNANDDSSRAGQWANGQAWAGVSNKTLGAVMVGRQNALSSDVIGNYDPVKSNAFSATGFSASYAGFGNTEISRINTAVTYAGKYAVEPIATTVRFSGQAQFGNGYYFGNAAMADYQGNIGVDYKGFSFDVVGGFAKDAVALSSYYGAALPKGYENQANNILKGTLSNNLGWVFAGKYKWDAYEVFAGYTFYRQMSPSDKYAQGFDTIAEGIFVPAGQVTVNKYLTNRILNTYWLGGKWATPVKDLSLGAGIYYSTQPNYNASWTACNFKNTYFNSSACAGSQLSYSFLATYKVLKRVDIYAGLMVSNVYGGMASGYFKQQNINPGAGVRFSF
jgi:predicted porin